MAKKQQSKQIDTLREHWKDEPEAHDFPAASDYLSLILDAAITNAVVDLLQQAIVIRRKAKDLLRTSDLALLPVGNPHVAADIDKVRKGSHLSPVLVVRGTAQNNRPLIIADGYHRICASYYIDENADIPCKMAEVDW